MLALTVLLGAGEAGAQVPGAACAPEVTGGTTFHFEEEAGTPISTGICFSSGFRCTKPEENGGPTYQLLDTGCDPVAGPCAVHLRVPIRFPGNQDNIDDGPFRGMEVRWYLSSTASTCSDPVQCGQVSTCGKAFTGTATIDTDRAVFTATRELSCADVQGTDQPLSLTAWACVSSSSCKKRLDVNGLDLDGAEVAAAIGCPPPPPPPLDFTCAEANSCGSCFGGGMSAGGGGVGAGGGGADGGPPTGEGAFLSYAGGGAGRADSPGAAEWAATLGRYWAHEYAQRIVVDPDDSHVWLITEHGSFREFGNLSGGVYETLGPADEYRSLHRTAGGWELVDLDGTVVAFDTSGRWASSTDRNGNAKIATYDATGLASVALPDGRREDFAYHPDGKLASITYVGIDGVTSRTWTYTWSGDDLVGIGRPDGTAIAYTYGDARYPGYLTLVELVGTDASRRVVRGYQYDGFGNAVRSWRGAAAPTDPAAVDGWQLAFDDPQEPAVVTVTDPLGNVSTHTYDRDPAGGRPRLLSVSGDCPGCGLGPNSQLFYEDAANPLRVTRELDGKGHVTLYTYDANGRMLSRTDAAGTVLERTTNWSYDAAFQALVAAIERPSVAGGAATRTTTFTRDAAGNPQTQTVSGVEAGLAFSHATQTTFNLAGRPLTVDPPGHGSADVTSFTYDATRGSLLPDSRAEPLVGTTMFGYDAFNRRTSVTDPNGLVVETEYDALGRVLRTIQRGATVLDDLVTENVYNPFGDLSRTVLPEGNVIEYGYDAAGRLVTVERKSDASTPGERTVVTLDAAGNRIREEQQRWDGVAWVVDASTDYVYSTRCHLDRVVFPDGSAIEHTYDCNGNLERSWDANHPRFVDETDPEPPPDGDALSAMRATAGVVTEQPPTTVYAYDALDRLVTVTQPWTGAGGGDAVTTYGYDVQDHLVSVTDAEGNTTTYDYSDRDLLTEEVSPASGTTTHAYDEAGELVSTTDGRGVTVQRTLDARGRVTAVTHPDASLDVTYTYDDPAVAFSNGRLTAITRGSSSVDYAYDRFGRTTVDGTLSYGYDKNGNRTEIGYPGGVVARTTYDFADRPQTLAVEVDGGAAQTLVSSAAYLASGPLSSLALGNGLTEARSFDARYFPTRIEVPGILDRQYATDAVGNVTGIDIAFGSTVHLTSYEYLDVAYFLTGGGGPWGMESWSYDRIGNRVGEAIGDPTADFPEVYTYSYAPNSGGGNTPLLDTITPAPGDVGGSLAFLHDGAGQQTQVTRTTSEGQVSRVSQLGYGDDGRLRSLSTSTGTASTAVTYDGRSFLAVSETTYTGSTDFDRSEATYGSDGVLHHRRYVQQRSELIEDGDEPTTHTTTVDESAYLFYFAGRPVAQLERTSLADTLLFLTTDHLGTVILATDASGVSLWQGGLSPFGTPYTLSTPTAGDDDPPPGDGDGDALLPSLTAASTSPTTAGVFLRFPGQWDAPTFTSAGLEKGVYYNLHRWYAPGTGRYTRPDPLGRDGDSHPYVYATANPLLLVDPLGLKSRVCCTPVPFAPGPAKHCFIEHVVDDNGESTTFGLHRVKGKGCKYKNDGFDQEHLRQRDSSTECGPWLLVCGDKPCLDRAFDAYPNPSDYQLIRGPNSNSFARTLANACGLTAPSIAGETGQTPGWHKEGRPAKNRNFQCPPRR